MFKKYVQFNLGMLYLQLLAYSIYLGLRSQKELKDIAAGKPIKPVVYPEELRTAKDLKEAAAAGLEDYFQKTHGNLLRETFGSN